MAREGFLAFGGDESKKRGKQGKDYSVPPDLVKMQEFFEKRKFPKVFRENFDENEIKSASADLQDHFHDNNSRH